MDPSSSELVAIGIALGAFAALVQLPFVRLRARLAGAGRVHLARATYPLGLALITVALVASAAVGALAAWSFLVGMLGARMLLIGDPDAAALITDSDE